MYSKESITCRKKRKTMGSDKMNYISKTERSTGVGEWPNPSSRWRMAGIFGLYKVVTWSSTKPNLKMEDGGNI